MNITFQGASAQLTPNFHVLFIKFKLVFFLYFLMFTSEIILKQLLAKGSVNIGEYLPRLRLGKYLPTFTLPSANNC